MLRSINKLIGTKLAAGDGHVGHVKDFYFDDQDWAVRYAVVDTGSWLPGRMVLLTPHALGPLQTSQKELRVNLTRKQIEKSPSVDLHKPVSRQYEEEYYSFYNWPFYWQGGALWGMSDYPVLPPVTPVKRPARARGRKQPKSDAHLRSAHTLIGYQIQGTDEAFGHVADFLMDDETWAIDHVIIDTGHWLAGKKVLVSPFDISEISWNDSKVFVDSTKAVIEHAPAYEASEA